MSLSTLKRSLDLEDASERAQKVRKNGLMRVPLKYIGFHPSNRGGLMISGHHVHEVAHDCMANKVKLQRYGHVDLIEIPPERLDEIRKINREKCEADGLLPSFSPEMTYVCASKAHFVHAQKLFQEQGRTLFNKGEDTIRLRAGDSEGREISANGVMASIYSSTLFKDEAALEALCSEDNFKCHVQLGEDEMQAFGPVHKKRKRLVKLPENKILKRMQSSGAGQFIEEWQEFTED